MDEPIKYICNTKDINDEGFNKEKSKISKISKKLLVGYFIEYEDDDKISKFEVLDYKQGNKYDKSRYLLKNFEKISDDNIWLSLDMSKVKILYLPTNSNICKPNEDNNFIDEKFDLHCNNEKNEINYKIKKNNEFHIDSNNEIIENSEEFDIEEDDNTETSDNLNIVFLYFPLLFINLLSFVYYFFYSINLFY